MAVKVLGQLNPSINVLTDFYTVPALKTVVTSSIVICNQSAVAVHFRISVAVAGAVDAVKQYLYYDIGLSANDTFIATIGFTLAASDVVRVRADSASVSFNLFGDES